MDTFWAEGNILNIWTHFEQKGTFSTDGHILSRREHSQQMDKFWTEGHILNVQHWYWGTFWREGTLASI
jgi:hypothetical protein